MTARVEWLDVAGEPAAWERIGLVVVDGRIPLHGTGIRIGAAGAGLTGWELSGLERPLSEIDGVPTVLVEPAAPLYAAHPMGAVDLDHVVLTTDSLERTSAALSDATDSELRRVREVGEIRQGFHRLGGLIVEIVERVGLDVGPAQLWGMVINVDDIDAAVLRIGSELVSDPRPAVQPGRSIATVRSAAGLGTAVALLSRPR